MKKMRVRSAIYFYSRGLLTGLLALMLSMPVAADVRARLDRDKVYVGDPVTLVIERSGSSSGEPDLSPLNKDFRVLGTGTSTQFSFINGRSSNSTTWTVQLGPLQQGKLRIPPIQVGAEQTAALELEVTEIPEQLAAQQSELLFLEADADTGEHTYVQQQIPYTLRLYHAEPLANGDLRPPQVQDASIQQLGNERRYTVSRNKRRYQVVERRYMISPEKSGELRIPPATFNGQLSNAQQGPGGSSPLNSLRQQFLRNSPFGRGGRSVRVSSKAITIDVLPRPSVAGSSWLPAENLELHDSWASDPPQFRAGEPVSRTISLRATGLSGTQIPALEIASPERTRVYPETPVNDSHTDGDKVYAVSRQTFTYIPGRAGELTIPAVELQWWDTRSDEQATARLPQWVVKVEPGTTGAPNRMNAEPARNRQPALPAQETGPEPQQPGEGWFEPIKARPWHWVVLGLLALAVLWLSKKWLGRRTREAAEVRSEPVENQPGRASNIGNILPQLQRACETGDAREAAQTLLELGRARWPNDPPRSLGQLASRLGRAQEHITMLDRALYAADASTWTGAELWASVKDAWSERAISKKTNEEPLQPLYPHSG